MYSGKFTVIFHLLAAVLLINCVTSAGGSDSSETRKTQFDDENLAPTETNRAFVATTPKITASERSTSEDDDDDEEMAVQQPNVRNRQSSDGVNPLLQIFNAISNTLMRSAARAAQKTGEQLIGMDRNEELTEDDEGVDDNDSVTERSTTTEKAVDEGRYIKGDPLNGYYDFVITEGSYKFWVVFQLGTAALLIYSTLAAIYYSKVNPLTSDYDYVDYLSRSFKGRSMDSTDVDDDDDDSGNNKIAESGHSYLSSLGDNPWVKTAAYGFQFAMDAIDKVPK